LKKLFIICHLISYNKQKVKILDLNTYRADISKIEIPNPIDYISILEEEYESR